MSTQRDLFEIPEDITFLNCATMSPLPRTVREAGHTAIKRKTTPWTISEADFFSEVETLRHLIADLIDGDPDGVAIIPSVSYGLTLAANNLLAPQGTNIVILAEQFPSNVYPWHALAKRTGACVTTVEKPKNYDWTQALEEAIKENTSIVAIPNCHWTDGSYIDLERVSTRCRMVGAALVIDVTQSLGVIPLSVRKIKPDFLVCAFYKWLLGPYSLGFLWASPACREGHPIEHSWLTREGSEDFSRLVDYRETYRPGARRYDVGEVSNFILVPMAIAAIKLILSWGISNIQNKVKKLTGLVAHEAEKAGFNTLPPPVRSPHIIGLMHEEEIPTNLSSRLSERNVYVSIRGSSIRVSPYIYNTKEDVVRLLTVLEEELYL